jgi:hypothetical protein
LPSLTSVIGEVGKFIIRFNMKYRLLIIVWALGIPMIQSCGKTPAQREKEEKEKKEQDQIKKRDTKRQRTMDFSNRYRAITGWDTLNLYTYELQDMVVGKDRPLMFSGYVQDIIKIDSVYLLEIKHYDEDYERDYLARITTNKTMLNELRRHLKTDTLSSTGSFIINVSNIKTQSPELVGRTSEEGENSYGYLDFDFEEKLLIIEGTLLDFKLDLTNDD